MNNIDRDKIPRSTRRVRRADRLVKLLVVDPDPRYGSCIAKAMPNAHVTLSAREPTMALAMCIRERPTLVLARGDLVTMRVTHFGALLDYAMPSGAPPIIGYGAGDDEVLPPVVAVLADCDPASVARLAERYLSRDDT